MPYDRRVSQRAARIPTFDETYRQIAALPDGVRGEILEPGVLRTMSRPGRRHQTSHLRILRSLGSMDAGAGGTGWTFEIEPEIRFPGGRLLVPDVAGWRAERVPQLPD